MFKSGPFGRIHHIGSDDFDFDDCVSAAMLSGTGFSNSVDCVTSAQRSAPSVYCVSSVGRAFTLAAPQSGTSVHAVVGGVGIRGEQRLAFARFTKPRCPAWCPHQLHHTFARSHSVTPADLPPQPQTHTHTHSPMVLAAPLPAYQKYARQNNGCFIHRKTGMCLNVAARVSLFSLSTLCVPHFP